MKRKEEDNAPKQLYGHQAYKLSRLMHTFTQMLAPSTVQAFAANMQSITKPSPAVEF